VTQLLVLLILIIVFIRKYTNFQEKKVTDSIQQKSDPYLCTAQSLFCTDAFQIHIVYHH